MIERINQVDPNRPEPEREGVLCFEPHAAGASVLVANPQRVFYPRGLMLWDVGTLQLEAILSGRDMQLICSWGKVPARWFTVAASFEQVVKARAEGKEPASGWGSWQPIYPGCQLRLMFDGPATNVQALMWGQYS